MLYYYYPHNYLTPPPIMSNPIKYEMDLDKHNELKELIEDSVEYFCDQHMISGELTWLIVETLATAKLAQMRGMIQ